MHRFLILSGFLVGAALLAPVAVKADDDNHHDRRYYDRQGRDYHTWNTNEDRAYRVYLGEQHRQYVQFPRVRRTQQTEYFRWRHEHPDTVIFKIGR
jgi:hypothetical protein